MLCKHSFNRYISRSANAGRKLATLGPSRTSSYAAARHFAQDYPADIALFPTYEEAADAVRAAPGESALIVANAYANINRFYISDVLHPIGAFFKDTPAYVVAARDDTALDGREKLAKSIFKMLAGVTTDSKVLETRATQTVFRVGQQPFGHVLLLARKAIAMSLFCTAETDI